MSQELINKMNTLIGVTGQSKPINFSGGLLGAISEHAATEEKRHGASNVPFIYNATKLSGSVSA